jgi:hypothetical protein
MLTSSVRCRLGAGSETNSSGPFVLHVPRMRGDKSVSPAVTPPPLHFGNVAITATNFKPLDVSTSQSSNDGHCLNGIALVEVSAAKNPFQVNF